MLIEHQNARPRIDPRAFVAPTATICGDVQIGPDSYIGFGTELVAEGGSIVIGAQVIVMETAVIRGTARHPTYIGDHVLVGPRAYLTGCTIEDNAFLATGTTLFNGARIGARAEVRINAVVHLKTNVPADAVVPIGGVAVGDPAEVLPPGEHDRIWTLQEPLNFAQEIFGLGPAASGQSSMPELTRRYARYLQRHRQDQILD